MWGEEGMGGGSVVWLWIGVVINSKMTSHGCRALSHSILGAEEGGRCSATPQHRYGFAHKFCAGLTLRIIDYTAADRSIREYFESNALFSPGSQCLGLLCRLCRSHAS
jgi:hypothetical protein